MRYKRTVFYSDIDKKWVAFYENKKGQIKKDKTFKTKFEAQSYYRKNAEYTTKKKSIDKLDIQLKYNVQQRMHNILQKAKKHKQIKEQELTELYKLSKSIQYKQKEVQALIDGLSEKKRKKRQRTNMIEWLCTFVFQNKTNYMFFIGKQSKVELKAILEAYAGDFDYLHFFCRDYDIEFEATITREELEDIETLRHILGFYLSSYVEDGIWIYADATVLLHATDSIDRKKIIQAKKKVKR